MIRVLFRRLPLFWFLLLATLFVIGCAGQKPKGIEKGMETPMPERSSEAPKKAEIPKEEAFKDQRGAFKVVSTPSGYVTKRMEGLDEETRGAVPDTGQSTPSSRTAESLKVRAVSKPRPIGPPSRPAQKPMSKDVSQKKGQRIVLNFDDADLYDVVNTFGELLGINYIIEPGVQGRVTIHTAGAMSKDDLLSIFFEILDVNGLTAIKEGGLYRIMPLKGTPRTRIDSQFIRGGKDVPPSERVIIQIIPLKFMSAQEMTKLVTPFVSSGGTIISDVGSNTLVVVDKGINILKILRLVDAFDVDLLERVSYRFYPIKYLDAEDVAGMLSDFTDSFGKVGNVVVKFIAISRLDTLLVVSTTPTVFEKVEDILRQIDVVDKEVQPRIYVYFVKNGEAEQLSKLLNKVLGKDSKSKDKAKDTEDKAGGSTALKGNPFSAARVAEKKAAKAAAESKTKEVSKKASAVKEGKSAGSESLRGEVTITPDEVRNALIIEAMPPDYRIVEGILRQIDVLPRQVLIEATIAEINVDTSTKLGMEWAFGYGAAQGAASFASTINKLVGEGADAVYTGLKYSIGVTDKWYAALNAMASEGRVNVLSSPHVLASDNKEAKIDVSREIPVASGTTNIVSGSTVSETEIEYRDTGVILSVTPHINDRGLVTMEISEEVSELEKEVEVAGKKYPSFFKRTVNTTLTVKHGQTIIIGGLIRDKEEEDISGLPCLIKVPVLKYLFGQSSKSVEKIELIILITPRVVANLDDVDAVTREFKQKVKNVMKRFYPK